MSDVRFAEDTALGRPVAVKLLRGDGDPRSVARFEQEARLLARLHHPNVVTVFDVGTDGVDRFIVMELVDGPTLGDVLGAEGPLVPRRAAGIAGGLADALNYAHEQDVVHRDVKPSNVLLAAGDHVKLADLGIAKLLSTEAGTATTGVIGTASYIAPEQARGDPVDGRADLYSLGCVLFEMLVGRPPFEGDAAALTYAHVHRPAPRTRSIAPAVPQELDRIVAALLEKDPSARPQTASEVRTILERSMQGKAGAAGIATEPLTRPEPTKRLPEDRSRPLIESGTPEPPDHRRPKRPLPRWIVPATVAALVGVLLLVLLSIFLAGDPAPGGRDGTGARSPQSSSPATTTSAPSPEPPSSREAAQHVFDVVSAGIAAGEVSGGIVGEVQHKIDEAFGEFEEHEDLEKTLDKIAELQEKVSDAREKGEITSAARARAIDEALDELAAALEAEA